MRAHHDKLRIIGFDLGHADTALTLVPDPLKDDVVKIDLESTDGRANVTVTAVAEHPTKGVLHGALAIRQPGAKPYLAWKDPGFDEEEVRHPTRLFVGAVRKLLTEHKDLPDGIPTRWVFGTPSGWDSAARETYRQVLREAGLDDVEVIPESRAALLFARDSDDLVRLGPGSDGTGGAARAGDPLSAGSSVLVVDLGSSTLDITRVSGLVAKPLDDGVPLGAGLIDQAIVDHLRREIHGERLERWLEPPYAEPDEIKRLLFDCRLAKEAFFCNDHPHVEFPVADRVFVPTGASKDDFFLIRLHRDLMDRVLAKEQPTLGGRGWREAYQAELRRAAEAADADLDLVILTGGASRMRFALEDAQEIFEAPVVLGHEPEFAIARGLSIAGRIGVRAAGFRADVRELLDGDSVEHMVRNRLPELAKGIGKSVSEGAFERHVLPAFRAWRSGDVRRLSAVQERIAESLSRDLRDPRQHRVQAASSAWLQRLRPDLSDVTDDVCRRWKIPVSAMQLPAVAVSGQEWELPSSVTGVIGDHAEQVAKIVASSILGVLLVVIAASGAAMGAGVGVVVTGAFAAGAYFFAREWTETRLREADIPDAVRSEFTEAGIRKKSAEMETQLRASVAGTITGEGAGDIVRQVSGMLRGELEQRAQEAELLIS